MVKLILRFTTFSILAMEKKKLGKIKYLLCKNTKKETSEVILIEDAPYIKYEINILQCKRIIKKWQRNIYKISQYFLSSLRNMLKSCSCTISLGRAFYCLIILTKNECKKQFTLANGCLNLNERFDLVLP